MSVCRCVYMHHCIILLYYFLFFDVLNCTLRKRMLKLVCSSIVCLVLSIGLFVFQLCA